MKIRLLVLAAAAASVLAAAPTASASDYVRGRVIVGYDYGLTQGQRASVASAARVVGGSRLPAGAREVRTRPGETVKQAIKRLRRDPRVRYAVPNYIAHASGFIPNDPGIGTPTHWQDLQWNFAGPYGVDAPDAWQQAIAAGAPGGRGVTVAVLDTGVAFENHGRYRRSPDLYATRFTKPYDFVGGDRHPNDANGHGTHVTSTIAEKTNNDIGLTGLAYGVEIMPVQVLDAQGEGDAGAIARAIRYAARNGAQVINMSLEFDPSITASQIPDIVSAVRYAHDKGVVVVGAAGNGTDSAVAYPARTSYVISVGGTTERGCQADYSNSGATLDVVAPGGGDDAALSDDPSDAANCNPSVRGRPVYQLTLTPHNVRSFGYPSIYEGTSMAAPHVSAIAALIIATGVIGKHPKPQAVEERLKATARDLGPPGFDHRYGYGLVNAYAAINPAVATTAH
ncbi:MAG: serine protease [Thermoleophilaceae bacterium]|jgi:serine protease|nr:serine protease [Thermoleophilaceae bacterium]